ncbi:MAG: protein-export chaperone SecB [Pseudomonadaceae bacterium]|nr:protein-export chaperone SecB [Pseudomonadaceae bacterium]
MKTSATTKAVHKPKTPKTNKTRAARPSKKTKPSTGSMKPMECFTRDLSFECFLPPHLHPTKDRKLEFQVTAGVRPVAENLSSVNLALRVRIHTPQGAPLAIAEMIEEGVFEATCKNEREVKRLYVDGAALVYEVSKKKLADVLMGAEISPPLPATVDFAEMWDKNHTRG